MAASKVRVGVRVEHDGFDGRVVASDGADRVVVELEDGAKRTLDAAALEPRCEACGASASAYCLACKRVAYCSTECQRGHWRVHRRACRDKDAPAEGEDGAKKPEGLDESKVAALQEQVLVTRFVDAMVRQDATEVKVQASKRPPDQRTPLLQAAMRVAMACGDDGSCDAAVKRDTAVTVARILRGGVRLSRDATLKEFQAYLETLQRHGRGAGDGRDVLRTSTRDALARKRSCAELDVLRPVRIVELERGRIASGRVLRCATITDAAKSTATIAVVERGAGFNASTCVVRARAFREKHPGFEMIARRKVGRNERHAAERGALGTFATVRGPGRGRPRRLRAADALQRAGARRLPAGGAGPLPQGHAPRRQGALPQAQQRGHADGCVEVNHWFGGSPPNFRTL